MENAAGMRLLPCFQEWGLTAPNGGKTMIRALFGVYNVGDGAGERDMGRDFLE